MVRDTPPSQDAPSKDASTHQIWNSYLKEYRTYEPDTKRVGRTDGRTVRLLYASQSSFGGIKILSGTLTTINGLDPDQDQQNVCSDLGPNFCKGYQQMTKVIASNKRVKRVYLRYADFLPSVPIGRSS